MALVKQVMLIRHPETEANVEGRYVGRQDSPITERGHAQIRYLQGVVAQWQPECVFTSPLERTRLTAEAVAPADAEVRVLDELLEVDFGSAEGATYAELRERGVKIEYLSDGPLVPGGETGLQLRERVGRAAHAIESAACERIAVVTHGGVLRFILAGWLGMSAECMWRVGLGNAVVAVVQVHDNGFRLLESLTPAPEL